MLFYYLGMRFVILLLLCSPLFSYGAGINDYKKTAEAGDAVAQHNLAQMYAKGDGVAMDDTEAVKWF